MKIIATFSFLLLISFGFSKAPNLDSLKQVVANSKVDTSVFNAYVMLSDFCDFKDIRTYTDPGIELGQKIYKNTQSFNKKMGRLYMNAGIYENSVGNTLGCLELSLKSIEYYDQCDCAKGKAVSLNNIGFVYKELADYDKALDYFFKSLKLRQEEKDTFTIVQSYNNIAFVNGVVGNNEMQLKYYQKGLDISKAAQNDKAQAAILLNMGHVSFEKKDYKTAERYFEESVAIRRGLDNPPFLTVGLNRLGEVYENTSRLEGALDLYNESEKILKDSPYRKNLGSTYFFKSRVLYSMGRTQESIRYATNALTIARELKLPLERRYAAGQLYKIHEDLGQGMKALSFYKEAIEMKDTLNQIDNHKDVIKRQLRYEFGQQTTADSIRNLEHKKVLEAQVQAEQKEKDKQKIITYATAGGLGLVAFFLFVVFNRLKLTRKQKHIIEEAHQELEEKNTEIMDSITYAKRIQTAILPPNKLVKAYLDQSFILYMPKDIVAGDFYWMEPLKDQVLIAAADCTGHGVPGAMVSVVCNNGLNRSVREFGLTDPGKILDKTRDLVIEEFEKSEEEVKDGMDIALVSLQKQAQSENKSESEAFRRAQGDLRSHTVLQYAGAHNPLWIIRKDTSEIEEIKANKQPIGQFDHPEPYTTHSIELQSGDTVYIFSDGYADQFGGEKGKKMKSKNFKQLLISMQHLDMEQQRAELAKSFEEWKGDIEQLDDVCVIGIRF